MIIFNSFDKMEKEKVETIDVSFSQAKEKKKSFFGGVLDKIKNKGGKLEEKERQELASVEHKLMEKMKDKNTGLLNEAKLNEIKNRAERLKSELKIKKSTGKIDYKKFIRDFDDLINLLDLEKKVNQKEMEIRNDIKQKISELKEIDNDIQKHEVATQIDLILSLVIQKESITSKELQQKTGLNSKQLMEFAEMLEEEGLIKIIYPAIGSIKLEAIKGD